MPLYLGRTVATAEGRIVDGEGRLVAHASALTDPGRIGDHQRRR